MKAQGILILSHVGFSFVDQLAKQADTQGMERFILSSLPEKQHLDRLTLLQDMGEWFNSTEQHELSWDDVLHAIKQIQSQGKTIAACVCVWEGYRELMARANEHLGIKDIAPDCVPLLTDKQQLRKTLYAEGLSQVVVEPLTEQNFLAYQQQGASKFIKPFRGIASFGTFQLTPQVSWDDIQALQHELHSDTVFSSIFAEHDTFIIEDFINGTEYSFEMLVEDGQQSIVAIHEKPEMSLEKMTTLENSVVCPPVSLTGADIDTASAWLKQIFTTLNIDSGCFHVEAKFDGQQWEIIEINPRVGGSLISQSVEHFTNGHSLLDMWIKLLLQSSQHDAGFSQLLSELNMTGANPSPHQQASFFRVFYGDAGTIETITKTPGEAAPLLTQVFVKAGDTFSSSSKENFVGQALWALDYQQLQHSYEQISQQSESLIKLTYQSQTENSSPGIANMNTTMKIVDQDVAADALLIIDFNLSRSEDVAHIRRYAATQYELQTVLIRANPSAADSKLANFVIDLCPLEDNFVAKAIEQINALPTNISAGVVFSDNAVHTGAQLLIEMGLRSDSSILAENAFCKHQYRIKEQSCKDMLEAQQMFVPNVQKINSVACLDTFINENREGVVIKPTTEGNNRGVVLLHKPTNADVTTALAEVEEYIDSGVIAEQMIPFEKEFSYDGIGSSGFVTEKFTAPGRYPVEYAQLVPADLTAEQAGLIARAGQMANMIVGQSFGPFHNEIRLSDDHSETAVIEANRRPAGMKIWSLASTVFEQDLYALWIDTVVQNKQLNVQFTPKGSAMSIMLPASQPGLVCDIINDMDYLFEQLQADFAAKYPQDADKLNWLNCETIAVSQKYIHVPPRDNSDFIALVTIKASWASNVMKAYLPVIQNCWNEVLNEYLAINHKTVA